MHKLLSSLFLASVTLCSMAQSRTSWRDYIQHLEGGLSVGTTGIGLDVAAPVNDMIDVRMGFSLMPQFRKKTGFDVQVGEVKEDKYDKDGNRIETKFDRMSAMLQSMTGFRVVDVVGMYCVPTYHNFKLVVDVKPFADKRWYVSGGFYWGNSVFARAYNDTEAMTSLLAVGMYNRIYTAILNEDPVVDYQYGTSHISFELPPNINQKFIDSGRMAMGVGRWKHDQYYEEDVYSSDGKDLLHQAGDLKHKAGSPYLMEPGHDGMVKVTMKTNRFKPYIGGGFHDQLDKEGVWEWSADAGILIWGGVPHMRTHEGVCLVHDVTGVKGKPGRYIGFARALPVFPVLEIRLVRNIF